MAKFTAKDFVDYVNDEFDSETLQLLKNVLDERLTFLRKMGDMANPRTVVQGYKLNKQDLKEMRGFTVSRTRLESIVKEEVESFLTPQKTEEKLYEFVENAVGSEVSAIVYEIANNHGYTGSSDKQFKTVTTQIRHILPQILQENRKAFIREVENTKSLMGIDEIVL
jgi:hypothetical protein